MGIPSPSNPPVEVNGGPTDLPRLLGPIEAITIVVGSMIGSGIFLKAGQVAQSLGSFGAIIFVWAMVGVITLCGALALAELATMLPQAGGPYVYLKRAYGSRIAYLWGWSELAIVRTGTLGSLSSATVIYLRPICATIAGYVPANWTLVQYLLSFPYWLQGVLTLGMVALLTWLNARGTKYGAWTQNVTTFLKVGFLLVLLLGPLLVGKWQTSNLQPVMPPTWDFGFWKSMGLAMMLVYWPYDGWINIGPVAEEIRDPQRNIPRGLVWGLVIVTLVYVGTITGYHLSMPMAQVAASDTIASDVFGALFGPWGIPLAAMGVMFSTFGALNSNLLAGPRIYFALARDGLLPRYLQEVHPHHKTPAKAIWTQGFWAMAQVIVMFCISSSANEMFDYLTGLVVQAGTLFYMLSVSAVIMLRFTEPSLARPYSCWGYPFTPLIYLLGSTAVLLSGTLWQVVALVALLAVGLLLAPWLKSSQS